MIKITRQTEGIRISDGKDNNIFIHDEDISELYVELYKVLPPGQRSILAQIMDGRLLIR